MPKNKKTIKAYAIVWKENNPFAILTVRGGDIVSIHKDKPIVSQDELWEVVEGEFTIQ